MNNKFQISEAVIDKQTVIDKRETQCVSQDAASHVVLARGSDKRKR